MTPQERIDALASARGGVGCYPAPRPSVSEPTKRVKLGPEHRKPPQSWRKIGSKDWSLQGKYRALQQAEARTMAWLVCRCLGPDWRKTINEHGTIHLTHTSGLRLVFAHVWNDGNRYRISPCDCRERTDSDIPSEITVSAGRTAASIAGDIQRRILAFEPVEAYEVMRLKERERNNRDNIRRLSVLSLAKRLGEHQLRPERNWSSRGYPETNTIYVNNCAVTASETYCDRFCLSVEAVDLKQLQRIAEFIKDMDA